MTGSEKQITWATSIRQEIIDTVELRIANADSEKQVNNLRAGLARLMSAPCAEIAEFWIETRRSLGSDRVARLGYSPAMSEFCTGRGRYTIPAAE